MKKFLFIIIILGTFSGYIFYVRNSVSDTQAIIPPLGLLSELPTTTQAAAGQGASPPPVASAPIPLTINPTNQPATSPAPTAVAPPVPVKTTTPTPAPVKTTPAPVPAPTPTPTPAPAPQGKYRNGTYTGSVADAYYGNIQVQVIISSGAIYNVVFLQYPNDRSTSRYINGQAMPYLKQEAITAQSANVDIVSGATDSSQAFQQSLAYALNQAKN